MSLITALERFCSQYGSDHTYWIAYSGGLDSHVLLSLLVRVNQQTPLILKVIHIHHGVNPNANQWAAHCANVCERYGIALSVHHLDRLPKVPKEGLEALLRTQRYAVFADLMQEGDILLTAHHQEDQAETILLQLLRGAGPKGLAGMATIKPFAKGLHGRPLLNFSRTELKEYAKAANLFWVEDESNQNIQFTRNFIRHEVLPLLKTRWPSASATLARSAGHCSESQALLEELMLTNCKNLKGSNENVLSISKLLMLSPAAQRLALRTWMVQQGFPVPNTKKLMTIQETVLLAKADKMPSVSWQQVILRRYRDDLYLLPHWQTCGYEPKVLWDLATPLKWPKKGMLQIKSIQGEGLKKKIMPVQVGFREGGEMVHYPGRGHCTLKKLFQEWGVPPWCRDQLPLIFFGNDLIAIPGYYTDVRYAAVPEEKGNQLVWIAE